MTRAAVERSTLSRGLLVLLCTVTVFDMTIYSVITPILPDLRHEHDLSDSMAGMLVAAYPVGLMIFALPAGLVVARAGAKRAVIMGVVTLAVSTTAFGLASSAEWLLASRMSQGLAAGLSWAGALTWLVGSAPRGRQGVVLGTVMGAAGVGAVAGPGLGVLAVFWGRDVVFVVVAVVALVVALALTRQPAAEVEGIQRVGPMARLLRRRSGARLAGVLLLAAAALGALGVLIPLRLDDMDTSAKVIGAIFLGIAALELVVAPLVGRWVDRAGPYPPLVLLLLSSTSVVLLHRFDSVLATSVAVLVCLSAVGLLYTPTIAGLTQLTQSHGLAVAGLFGLSNFIFAIGEGIGALSAGWLEEADLAAQGALGLALLCVAAALLVLPAVRREPARVPGGAGLDDAALDGAGSE